MINLRIIARIFSLMLIVEGLFMLLSGGVSWIYDEPAARSFLYSAIVTFVTGVIVFTPLRNEEKVSGKKEGYIIITGIWVLSGLFGTLPYLFSGSVNNFPDALFESVSGFTTTGATILDDVGSMQRGILFWRSLTQWIGGLGVIFISLYILPVFRSVFIQVPAGDFSGQPSDRIHPRLNETIKRLFVLYTIFTFTEAFLLTLGGMPLFDSVCHSFSTLSTGGFTTGNESLGVLRNPFIIIVLTLFMFAAGTNMAFIYFILKGNYKKIFGNNEFLFYTLNAAIFCVVVSAILIVKSGMPAGRALLEGSFHAVSLITTTGFYFIDPVYWSEIILIIFFVLMFTGGTSGSTSGGIKMIRLLLVTKNSRLELIRLIHPSAYIPVRVDNRVISQTIIYNLLVFLTLYFFSVCISSFFLSLIGYDLIPSFSISASMLANIGPGIGHDGFFISYSDMPEAGKWFSSVLMIAGRLELFTLMVLFSRSFFRN